MKITTCAIALSVGLLSSSLLASGGSISLGASPDDALKQLVEGNARYVAGTSTSLRQDQARRCETYGGGQHPVAAILSCADSRVPVEVLYDQGVGDVFVIRVAGNIAATDEIGSIEYGVEHLGIPLVVVMGHNKCGAVTAALGDGHAEGNVGAILKAISPAASKTKEQNPKLKGDALVTAAVKANVQQAVDDMLAKSELIRAASKSGKIKIVGAMYDLHTGGVEWLTSLRTDAKFSSEGSPAAKAKTILGAEGRSTITATSKTSESRKTESRSSQGGSASTHGEH